MHVAAAVSGGMDSLLALALLAERGVRVTAVHGFFLPPDEAARAQAEALAAQCAEMGVPCTALDLSEAFRREVVEPFTRDYVAGRTPNPCALCNPRMKFGLLFDAARDFGATHLATGHYATLLDVPGKGRRLARGVDPAKDQSYFLSLVPRERLEQALFPLGTWRKQAVPGELDRRGITPPLPSESQEICFIPDDDYCAFLERSGTDLPGAGPIRLKDGTVLGEHRGLWRHTQGQRRGMGIAYAEPLYVVGKEVADNALVVGTKDELSVSGCRAAQVNLLVPPGEWPERVLAQTRYRQRALPARARVERGVLHVDFEEPHPLPAPGQIAAVYDAGGAVLAGGVIVS